MASPSGSYITDKELAQNKDAESELVNLILSRESVLCVGAGFSQSCGFPVWDDLLNALRSKAQELDDAWGPSPEPETRLDLADAIHECIAAARGDEAFGNEIGRIFRDAERELDRDAGLPAIEETERSATRPDSIFVRFHIQLVKLPFRGFLTTNYDYLLEKALVEAGRCEERPTSVSVWRGAPRDVSIAVREIALADPISNVLHLHGDYRRPTTIVLSGQQYSAAYGIGNAHRTHLFHLLVGILMTRRIVFVGFSLEDPYIARLAQLVSDLNWEWGEPVHFAILPRVEEDWPETKKRAQGLKDDLGIQSVFYEARPDDHSNLHALIDRTYQAYAASHEPTADERARVSPVPETGGAIPDWVVDANRAAVEKVGGHED